METPNAALRRARIEAGMSQRALARAMQVSQAYITDLERCRRRVHDELARRMPEPIGGAVRKALAWQHRVAALQLDDEK